MPTDTELRETVRQRYAQAATTAECCETLCCTPASTVAVDIRGGSYQNSDLSAVPQGAAAASLGCGNPTAVADLSHGEKVLDLGSGGGIDVLLAARRVGPSGFVYGLDMTDEMLELAGRNAAESGVSNVQFLKGYIEAIPLPDRSVDVVISNCVINLSVDKPAVFAEIKRVLRDGGRIGVTDVVAEDALSPQERSERGEWAGCIAGALSFSEYRTQLQAAGFVDVSLQPTHEVADGMHSVIVKARAAGAGDDIGAAATSAL